MFNLQFPYYERDYDMEKKEGETNTIGMQSYRLDVSDALQDLGELGFVVGYILTQCLGMQLLNASGYIAVETDGIGSMMVILLIVWIIFSKAKDYHKANTRAKAFENANIVQEAYYVQMA